MIKNITVCFLLLIGILICMKTVLAQGNDPNVEPLRRGIIGTSRAMNADTKRTGEGSSQSQGLKRMGWDNSSSNPNAPIFTVFDLSNAGERDLQAGLFSTAEAEFRASILASKRENQPWTSAYEGLARVLTAQGKTAEAIQTYQTIFYDLPMRGIHYDDPKKQEAYRAKVYQNPVQYGGSGSVSVFDGLYYALLLNETGQWPQAVNVYESALRELPAGDLPRIDISFAPETPQPVEMEAALHLALGLADNFGPYADGNNRAMVEYSRAMQMEPNWVLTNYYYGYGWQRLSPAERVKVGSVQQAKAALQKAVLLGKGDVKKAAQKALKDLNKPTNKPA
jgi:tetratricopeptide (TPR) repeat protein